MSRAVVLGRQDPHAGSPLEEDFYKLDSEDLPPPYLEPKELLAVFKQKEKELILAAEVGKALLAENQELKRETEKRQEDFTQKLEELEQEKHMLRLKYEGQEVQWDTRVSEMENDNQELQREVWRLQQALQEAEKDKLHTVQELTGQNQKLTMKLNKTLQAEQRLAAKLQILRVEHGDDTQSVNEDITQEQILQDEVMLLSQRNRDLEQRVLAMSKEKEALQEALNTLMMRVALMDTQNQEQLLQLGQAQSALQETRALNHQLQVRIQELQEEVSLHERSDCNLSLLSEIKQSLEAGSLGKDKKEILEDIQAIHQQLLSLTNSETVESPADSALTPPSLCEALSQLRELVQALSQRHSLLVKSFRHLKPSSKTPAHLMEKS
nr:PREDICTED: bicaudal D-related protein 1-like [Latimeria chalumnae]|eukprot:XP_014341736.1 PREDICTED: bicaudal D-related protein 1-like [Latimeria chalumnae]